MKMGYIALALLILISILLIVFNIYLSHSTNAMCETIKIINNSIKSKNYTLAATDYKQLKNQWKNTEKIIHFLISNDEIDDINEIFAEMDSYFEKKFFEEYFKTCYKLDFHIRHLYEKNQLNIETVF